MTDSSSLIRTQRRSAAQTREHLLRVAGDLFYREGIRATGVDRIAARAEVAPPTLYRLFASKDDLVSAYVERCSAAYRERLTAATASTGSAQGRILAVFDVFADDALSDACRGCPFLMVLAEFPDPESGPHVRAVEHKRWLRELLGSLVGELAHDAPIEDPDVVADQLALLAEGVYGSVQALGARGPARRGRALAEVLLELACFGTAGAA